MRLRPFIWILLCLLCLAGAWFLWRQPANTRTKPSALQKVAAPAVATVQPTPATSKILTPIYTNAVNSGLVLAGTNQFAFRLANTAKTIGQLVGDRHAILLENALIDTASPLNFSIPKNLQSQGDPGAYIVQARGPIDNAFRALLARSGAEIVSYIPNDAYLVRAPAGVANGLAAQSLVQAVTPYEPYYKISSSMPVTVGQKTFSFVPRETNQPAEPSLLVLAVNQAPLPVGTYLTLGLFNDNVAATVAQIEKLGGQIVARDKSPFGPVMRVTPPADWVALAVLPGVQIVEPYHPRLHANDLSRATVGVAADTQVSSNYLGLTGLNVLVEVDDSGIDADHPDLAGRVFGDPANLVDTDGHGTHVAGTIAGNGSMSSTVTNAQGSIMPATNGQFRGMASGANLLSMDWNYSDRELQEVAALTNAPISNNSWNYGSDNAYDLAAASYDAAVRDALPEVTGSQPVLFVFSAGNSGNGDDSGANGNADSILSPATAKNVITVGALEQLRGITNEVTGYHGDTNPEALWQPMTDTGYSPFGNSTSPQVASYSSRGNVGVGTEGTYGRFKPDVVAPGSFVVSTRSEQWDEFAYYNPTNVSFNEIDNEFLATNALNYYKLSVPPNAVGVDIQIVPNNLSPVPFPTNLSVFVSLNNFPDPANPGTYDIVKYDNEVSIPPDSGGSISGIQSLQGLSFNYAVWNTNSFPVYYNVDVFVLTTNNIGDYFEVLSNLNQSIGEFNPNNLPDSAGPYYRYESGTSMSAADVSGVLALMEDYFTNQLQLAPSPALLKAMLINGARSTGNNKFGVTNAINFEGWGLVNLPNMLPPGITNQLNSACDSFFVDQSPANALATGDSHTYTVAVDTNTDALFLPLRVTLVWTDPPGDPAAAIKLVNNLDLVVSNTANGAVYFGNNFASSGNPPFSQSWNTNFAPNLDFINNVENIFLPPLLAGNYSITVVGRNVNVNAVTAQTNNVVQDYALVISCGEGEVTNAFTVTDNGIVSNPTGDQDITFVMTNNSPLLNQIAGASPPLLGTNNLPVGTNTIWGSNGVVTLGLTNQWHFYVVTNTGAADFTNAAFITFIPSTLALPRMGVFADSTADSTRPQSDIDLYVAGPNDPNASALINLDPTVLSNCLAGANGDAASLTRGGTEFVVYTNSAPGDVYYIGVYSEDREGTEFGFIPIFTDVAFSQPGPNGSQIVNGLNVPVNIPDASSAAHSGIAYVFAIALYPMEIDRVVVTNEIWHQNFGDLIGALQHGGTSGTSQSIILNNHDTLGNTIGLPPIVYDDSGRGDMIGSIPTDGPGSLNSFIGQEGSGVWILAEVDTTPKDVGSIQNFTMKIEPHQNLKGLGVYVAVPAGAWYIDYLDVPAGFTNLSIFATNLPPTSVPPLQLYLNYNVQPNFTNYLEYVLLTNGLPPGNFISYGPPLQSGRYFVGLYNPDTVSHDVYLLATLGGAESAPVPGDYTTNNGPVLLDDAVSSSTIFVSSTQQIASLNVGFFVEHPRISDLTFTLVSPTGQRILLMENRGGTTTNGAGGFFITTNNFAPVTANGNGAPQTNYLNLGQTSGSLTINYDMYGVPDQMTVYYGTNSGNFTLPNALFNSGFVSYTGTVTVNYGPGTSTYVTIIMNQFGNPAGLNGTAWTYTAGGVETNYNYLAFTEDTNLATIPIKFAIPPFDLADFGTNYSLSDFELATNGDYLAPTNIFDAYGGWNLTNHILVGTNLVTLTNNEVSVITDPANAAGGSNFLALAGGTIFRQVPMTPGRQFSLSFMYRGPGISGWWRGEGNATDSANPENNGNNGSLIGRFNYPAGEVGQAFEFEDAGAEFQFAGTNTYVQIRQPPFLIQVNTNSNPEYTNLVTVQSSALDVGTGSGFTIEGWINPTNASLPQPLVEWLARVPTNGSDTNLVIEAGPFLNRATGHYYYLLGSTNWTTSEIWATQLGGHLATIETANEENWVYDTFAGYGGTNRNLWIGLTNDALGHFGWSSGLTNVVYTNWTGGGPTNCSGSDFYTAILGQTNAFPGLWVLENNNGNDNNGVTCGVPPTNQIYGVVEVEEIQTNGVQLWISVTVTNDITSSNSCLYANLVDTTNGSHIIYSASGLVQSNVWQHVALTYSTNSGVAALYYNGTNVASTNLGVFTPKTTGDVLLGRDMTLATNNFYGGEMDEMSIYGRCLSASEIAAIYNISALTTNRNTGKFDPSITPALSLAEAQVSFGGLTNIILGENNNWQMQNFSFIATTNSLPLQITGMEPGMLLDSFSVAEAPLGNLYYLPEQSLDSLTGTSAHGTWTLQIWDNRAGAFITNGDQLISWQLQIVLQNNSLPTVALDPETATTITVPPDQIVYLTVAVPTWANFATNILVSATAPVDLLFNQTNPPTGSNPNDFTLLTASTGGIGVPVLAAKTPVSTPPLLPGQTYYLGVRNTNAHAVTAVIQVDYDILTLTNGVPVSDMLTTNVTDVDRYYAFDVTSNAYEATFQLLQLSGNADLVVRKGTPLPTLLSSDYGSFNAGNADENIYVFTNSSPVPLSAGRWYLGVIPRDPRPIKYAVLAKELDLQLVPPVPNIIVLTNNVPFNFTAGPGAALTNFFLFTVTNFPPAVRFELYNLSGNGDLTVQTNAPPFGPPFFQTSQQPGRSPELIFMATNSALSSLTNSALTNLNAQWYLGVPNCETNLITYTIVAMLDTNGYLPAFPGAAGAGGGAAGGGGPAAGGGHGTNSTVYHVYNLADSGPGSLRDAVSATNRTVVFDLSGIIKLLSPLVITNSYLTIAGQTAPGGGITVAGQMTMVQLAHDVIIRDLRFRPSGAVIKPVVTWFNGFEGSYSNALPTAGTYFAGGWYVNSGDIDILSTGAFGGMFGPAAAYEGTNYIDINGNNPGTISTNVTTVPGMTYMLGFAYSRNPDGGSPDVVQLLVNSNSLLTLSVAINNSWANLGWATTSVVFTATAPTTQIQFASQTAGAYGVLLDAISLSTNVPANTSPGDSLQFTNVMDVIADHVSTSWSTNDLVSVLDSTNVTVQWSIMADSLHSTNSPDGYGSWLRYGQGGLSFHHNLYANNYSANPRLGDNLSLDFVNNVIYNWGIFPGYSTNDMADNPPGFTNQLNYACNYLIAGPDSVVTNFAIAGTNLVMTNIAFWGGSTNTWIYQSNNIMDSDTNRALNGADTEWGMFTNLYTPVGWPFPLPPVPTDEAFIAYEKVLDFAGVSLFARDWADAEIVTGVRTQTGRIISKPPLGLIGWWPGDGNANDIVGGNNGVAVNTTYTNGVVHQAFAFNSSLNSLVSIPDQPDYVLTNSLTIECWVRPATTQLQMVFWRGDQRPGLDPYFLQMNADGTIQFAIDDPANHQVFVKTPIANNQWTHVAGTLDGNTGTMCIYTNGVLAAQTITSFRPLGPLDPTQDPAIGIGNLGSTGFSLPFNGDIDEVSLYGRALSATEVQYIYNAGSAGKYVPSPPPPLDSDQDGIPDYWEITFGTDPFVASNNQLSTNANYIGYTDLEEYLGWLAGPHALTATNTPVGVDLYRLAGDTGNLSFSVTNAVNGTVYLTNVLGSVTNTGPYSNSIAIFTPATNYSGYASFGFFVTNNDTVAWFGPVTVSVVVSAVPVLNGGIVTLTNQIPYNDPTGTNGVDYYRYDVSTNAVGVEFQILNASGNVVLLARYGLPLPSLGNFDYSANAGFGTNASILVLPNSSPVPLTNGWWYLAVSNASGGLVDYTILVTELVAGTNTPPVLSTNLPNLTLDELTTLTVTNTATDANTNRTLTYTVTMSVDTNAMTLNGWPLTYVTTSPPPVINANGIITWTPSEAQGPGVYIITTIVTDNGLPPLSATNSFTVTVNEVNVAPVLPAQTNRTIIALATLIVTNTATDSDIPPNPLTYQLIGPPGAVIDTNGIITWTPTLAQAPGFYTFTTIVTDTNQYAVNAKSLSATNVFTVTVTVVGAPFVFTQPAQSVTGTGAQLNGMATPNGLPTAAWFQWGVTTHYGNLTPAVNVGASFNVVYTTSQISGLVANVPYHFRLVASNAVGVVYGFDQILDEANVVVWGADFAGQANVPPGLSNVVAVAGAYDHSLALKNDGTAVAWGDNTFGQTNVPAGLNNVVAVAGGEYYSLALKNSGTVAAWGANILGQTNVPSGLNNVVMIAGGTETSLALKNDGTVVAWGANFFGLTNVPAGLNNAVAIAGGEYHNLAIRNNGTVMVWGDNSAGQTNVPADLTNVVAIAGGSYHSLALKYDGTVVAWGDDNDGQTNVPAGLSNVVAIAAGGFHSLALKNDGTVVAWGDNTAGQTSVPVGLSNVVATASGYLHSLALAPLPVVNPTNPVVLNITNGVAQTNSILAGGITYYQVNVPPNADFATNLLLFTLNGPLNVWFTTNSPPTITNPGAVDLMPNATNGLSILSTTSVPTNIVPGATYYLGVQNTNSFTVNYGIEVDFHLLATNTIFISSITATNIGGTNGYLLQWQGPTNFQYEIQWTASFTPVVWNTILNPVINVSVTPTNGHYSFFDDGSLTGGLGPMRFYRVLGSLNLGLLTPSLPTISTQTVAELTLLTVTNTATNGIAPLTYSVTMSIDANAMTLNGWPLTYVTLNPPPVISANGIITWTPSEAQGPGIYTIKTIVTSSGVPPFSATNSFVVIVNEVNQAPYFLSTPANQTIGALSTLTVTNAAGDPDIPPNPLTYTLLNPPAGMTIDTNGVITWTPTLAQALTTNLITTVVTDFNVYAPVNQHLSATNTFTVRVPSIMPAFAFTQPAQSVTGTGAQLNGMATPNGPPTTAWFEWGTSAAYGNQTPPVNVGGSYSVVYVTSPITNLVMNQPYHFRLVVSNAIGVVHGFDQLFDEANVVAWGANYVGQTNVPPGLSNVVAVAGAYDHSLALKNNGTAVAWGDNTFGQTNVPAGLNNVVAVAGGEYYSLALKNSGTVAAWGANILGQTNVPSGLNNVVTIAGGTYTSLALKNDGTVVAWGYIAGLTNVPAGLSNAVAIAGGSYHNLAVKNDGTVVAWGDNSAGQTNVPAGLTNVVAIAGGSYHSLALKYDGTVVVWGDNSAGQTNMPAGLSNVVAVAAGGYHSLALKNDGKVLVWGDNSTNQTSIPSGLSNVVAISSGYFHNLALASPFNVNVTNTPPFWVVTNLPPVTLDELTTLSVTNTANDADRPPQTLTYTVTVLVDTNAMIANGWPLNYATTNPPPIVNSNGVITWTPDEAQGPGVYIITAVATDNGAPPLSVTNSFTVTVNEVNLPPVLPSQPDYTINRLTPLVVDNTATDPDIPPNPLTYQLSGPAGATIDTNGVIAWTPTLAQGGTTNVFTTIVTDTNVFALANRSLSATNSFTVVVTMSINLTDGQPQTNTIAAGGIVYYAVTVPANADFATNRLLFATAPVNVWFDTNAPPTTNRLLLPDVTYPTGTDGTVVLSTNATPPLVPGSTYYLGVENTNAVAVTFAVTVDFHLVPPLIVPPTIASIIATNIGGTNGFLLTWYAPTNDHFMVQWTASLPPLNWQTFTNIIGYDLFISPTNSRFTFFDDGSQTSGFGPMRYYRLFGLGSGAGLTNGAPQTNTLASGGLVFYRVNVPANADEATNRLLFATGPLNVWFTTNLPPTFADPGDRLLITNATSGSAVLDTNSTPELVPGSTYYLGVQNTNGTAVAYAVGVDFHLLLGTNAAPPISSITATNGGFLLTWYAPTNYQFRVRWTASLTPIAWNTFSNLIVYTGPVTPTNGRFWFFDDGTQFPPGPMRFYQLVLVGTTTNAPASTNAVIIASASVMTNGFFRLQWTAATSDYFQVEWTTNLLPPVVWFTNAGNIASATTNFTFVDTNALTSMKFYRLIRYP